MQVQLSDELGTTRPGLICVWADGPGWQGLTLDEAEQLVSALQHAITTLRRRAAPPSGVEDLRAGIAAERHTGDDETRRRINAKGPFRCTCIDRVFDDIDAYLEHRRVLPHEAVTPIDPAP